MFEELQERLGYRFQLQDLLVVALTHSSAADATLPRRGEQLEFLGDAVVGLVLSDLLIQRYPGCTEGELSKYRAALVSTVSLASKCRSLGLHEAMRLGKGEEKTGGRQKASILAALYESVIGAVFLEGGYQAARDVVQRHFLAEVAQAQGRHRIDAKTELQEFCQRYFQQTPRYDLVSQSGPDHAREFVVDVLLNGFTLARGEGSSKRAAEQKAAGYALEASHTWSERIKDAQS